MGLGLVCDCCCRCEEEDKDEEDVGSSIGFKDSKKRVNLLHFLVVVAEDGGNEVDVIDVEVVAGTLVEQHEEVLVMVSGWSNTSLLLEGLLEMVDDAMLAIEARGPLGTVIGADCAEAMFDETEIVNVLYE